MLKGFGGGKKITEKFCKCGSLCVNHCKAVSIQELWGVLTLSVEYKIKEKDLEGSLG